MEHDIRFRLGTVLTRLGQNGDGVAEFRTLVEKFPESPHRAQAAYQLGAVILREENDPVQAIAYFESALDAGPDAALSGRILRDLALARYEHNDFDQAADLFLRIMQDHPDIELNEETYAWAGQHFFDQSAWEEARQAFAALLRVAPEYPNPERVLFKIAEASEEAGRIDQALEEYQQVASRALTSNAAVEAAYRMAGIHEARGDLDQALELYEDAANANSGDLSARARFRLGELFANQGEHGKAARSFMRVAILFLHPELSPEALWRAGQSYEEEGNAEQALRAYNELLSDFPESAVADQARQARDALAGRE